MTEPKSKYGEDFIDIHFRCRGKRAIEFLKILKKFHLKINKFVQEAVEYYIPIYKENIQFEVLEKYDKLMESQERWDELEK